ncbi:LLM class flavin-dependent oxidoreductase [Halorientalis brevis]|uniref:LLM class flavin-dependent oxidoreductase n=1 Tax=Halorientalis brevis TaxID=1126241 RepID=A0ABD6CCB5_9EURY|nr:LLM class flavin-dependent oxidoreductase [Halorientalis brevis]
MEPGLLLPPADVMDPVGVATTAEELGYDSVWMPELWGSDAFVQLGVLARETEEVGLGTAIANVFSRSPAVVAMAAATVDRFADGRMTLGTGVSTPKAVEDLHGMEYDRPVRRAHETIAIAKRYLSTSDEPVSYDGELFEVADFDPLEVDVPIYHAALGPANRRVVARLADGWIPHNVPFPDLDDAFAEIEETARAADRDPAEITVAPYVPAAVSEENPDAARDAIRGHVAYYVGSGEGYRRAVAQRFPDAAATVADHWRDGDRDAATEAVTDEMVDALGVAGSPSAAREQLERLQAGLVDLPIVTVPAQAAGDLALETIRALAPE